MQKTVVNAETGEVITVDLTSEEIAEQEALAVTFQAEQEVYVPQSVPMWAVRTVLETNGLINQVQNVITSSNNVALRNIWEYGNFAERTSPAINELASSINLTDQQIDQMFRDAGKLLV